MKVTIEKKHGSKIEFTLEGVDVSFVNMLRRYATARVPVFAIDKVTFYENTSSMFDEYLAHRIGLIPIITPDKVPIDAEVTFSLDQTGPRIVYSKDLKSSDNEIIVGRENIPIITLGANQRLHLEGTARIGTMQKHAKFQAGLVSYAIEDDNKFRVKVETFSQMPPQDLMLRGCRAAAKDAAELRKELQSLAKKKKQ